MDSYIVNFTLTEVEHLTCLCNSNVDISNVYQYEVFRQRNYPMCMLSAWMTLVEYMRQLNGMEFKRFSRVYQYYLSRVEDRKEKMIMGISFRSIIESLLHYGAIEETDYNDNFSKINEQPLNTIIEIAKTKIFSEDLSIRCLEINTDLFKIILSFFGVPIVISGLFSTSKMYSKYTKIFDSSDTDNTLFHSVCIVGYDDNTKIFKFQNSFGSHWHDSGFGYFTEDFLCNIKNAFCLNKSMIKCEENEENIDMYFGRLIDNVIDNI